MAYESGAEPVVLLSKADLCADVDAAVATVGEIVPGTPVHAVSARTGDALAVLDTYCRPGRTAVFLGPSGVGKTTLLNLLTGTDRPTAAVREDGRGRHTTTHRELVLVEGRGLVIDTPGMRELQLWDADAGLSAVFGDIDALARTVPVRGLRAREPSRAAPSARPSRTDASTPSATRATASSNARKRTSRRSAMPSRSQRRSASGRSSPGASGGPGGAAGTEPGRTEPTGRRWSSRRR